MLGMLGLALLLAPLAGQALNDANAVAQSTSSPGDVTLTIYQDQNFALVADERQLSLREGMRTYGLSGLSRRLVAETVEVEVPDAPERLQLVEQTVSRSRVSPDQLLADHIGEQIEVFAPGGSGTYRGTLISTEGGITLEDDAGRVHVIRDATRFSFAGESSVQPNRGPELNLRMQSETSGTETVQLRYLSQGFNWTPHYTATLSEDRRQLRLKSWVSLENQSGVDLSDVTLRLLAGEVSRAKGPVFLDRMSQDAAESAPSASGFEGEAAFEYQLYTLGRPADLPDGQSVRQAFLPPVSVEPTVDYIYDAEQRDGVQVWVATTNDNAASKPLPAGRVRLYQQREGSSLFIGEDAISATPVGEQIRLFAGQAFDLRGERVQTKREQLGERHVRASYEITLVNRKPEEVTIEVREHFRGDWTITRSSLPFERLDSQTATFDVTVAPKSRVTLSYTVETNY